MPGAAQHVGDLVVGGGDAGLGVDDEEQEVGVVDGGLDLGADGVHVGAGAGDAGRLREAAGVDEVEDAVAPLDLAD